MQPAKRDRYNMNEVRIVLAISRVRFLFGSLVFFSEPTEPALLSSETVNRPELPLSYSPNSSASPTFMALESGLCPRQSGIDWPSLPVCRVASQLVFKQATHTTSPGFPRHHCPFAFAIVVTVRVVR